MNISAKKNKGTDGKKKSLRWGMVRMLLFGWFFPLLMLILIMIFLVANYNYKQVERSILSSLDKAADMMQMQLRACEIASKNASYMEVIEESYLKYREDGNSDGLKNSVEKYLRQQYKFDENCKTAEVVMLDNPETSYYALNNRNDGTFQDVKFFRTHAMEEMLKAAESLDTGTALVGGSGRVYMVRNLVDSKFRPYAVLCLELALDSLIDGYAGVWGYEDAGLYWNGELLVEGESGMAKELPEHVAKQLEDKNEGYVYRMGTHSYAYRQCRMYGGTLTAVVWLNNRSTQAGVSTVYYVFLILLVFMIPLILQTMRFFHEKVTVPLRELIDAADAVREGKLGIQIKNQEDNEEFYRVKDSFNHMSCQLKTQFDKIYLEEIALRDARIMALQSQINPHFLNNTLEIINWEARLNGNYKVSSMIEALSTMLGETMNRKEEQFHSVAEEMAYADAYLYIISQRFGAKFQCTKKVDESLLDVRVPRLIIQPIVENAVEHGVDVTRNGHLEIRIFGQEGGYLRIEVEDNGHLSKEDKEKINRLLSKDGETSGEKRVSLGIRNVDQRIKMIYGYDCGLYIDGGEQENTISTILIKIKPPTGQE